MTCASLQIFFDSTNQGGLDGECDMYGGEDSTEKEKGNFEDLGVDGSIILN
jgi:hypothetical protein